jgi:hypothetical protein
MSCNQTKFKVLRDPPISIMFFGTPHRGSDVAGYGDMFSRINAAFRGGMPTSAAKELETSSQVLRDINRDFKDLAVNYDIVSVCETLAVPYVGLVKNSPTILRFGSTNHPRSSTGSPQLLTTHKKLL